MKQWMIVAMAVGLLGSVRAAEGKSGTVPPIVLEPAAAAGVEPMLTGLLGVGARRDRRGEVWADEGIPGHRDDPHPWIAAGPAEAMQLVKLARLQSGFLQ